ncbi:MAG: peptidoglycan-binding protein [Rhodospirillales bacterium]|nr:MAG: peptidoglycan-binding protein [Rhodospirillales bacterium]
MKQFGGIEKNINSPVQKIIEAMERNQAVKAEQFRNIMIQNHYNIMSAGEAAMAGQKPQGGSGSGAGGWSPSSGGGLSKPQTNPSGGQSTTIRMGSSGPRVAYCQNILNVRMGPPPLWVDGVFGAKTDARVKQFQASRGLAVDGIVGPMTWAALHVGPTPKF